MNANIVPVRAVTAQGPPAPKPSESGWRWNRASYAGIIGLIFVVGGLIGLGWVGSYWVSVEQCPTFPNSEICTGPPPPLPTENATVIVVGTVVSTAVLSLGILFVFVGAYFPALPETQVAAPAGKASQTGPEKSETLEPQVHEFPP
jgi:hypothetical protein